MAVVGVLIAIGLIGYISIPSIQGTVNRFVNPVMQGGPGQIIENIKGLIAPTFVTVTPDPDEVSASDELEGFEGRRAVDVFSNTDWQFNDPEPASRWASKARSTWASSSSRPATSPRSPSSGARSR